MGSLFIEEEAWYLVAPTLNSPQLHSGGGEVHIHRSTDQGRSWNLQEQVTENSPRNHNYVRRVVNGQPPFEYFWADGNPEEFSISQLYIGDLSGSVIALPYVMEEDSLKLRD